MHSAQHSILLKVRRELCIAIHNIRSGASMNLLDALLLAGVFLRRVDSIPRALKYCRQIFSHVSTELDTAFSVISDLSVLFWLPLGSLNVFRAE